MTPNKKPLPWHALTFPKSVKKPRFKGLPWISADKEPLTTEQLNDSVKKFIDEGRDLRNDIRREICRSRAIIKAT